MEANGDNIPFDFRISPIYLSPNRMFRTLRYTWRTYTIANMITHLIQSTYESMKSMNLRKCQCSEAAQTFELYDDKDIPQIYCLRIGLIINYKTGRFPNKYEVRPLRNEPLPNTEIYAQISVLTLD